MRPTLFEARYYETYFVANTINNILANPFDYLRMLDKFYGDLQYVRFLEPFQEFSAFHQFIEFTIHSLMFEELGEVDLSQQRSEEKRFENIRFMEGSFRDLPINHAMSHYEIEHESFVEWLSIQGKTFDDAVDDDAYDYYSFLLETGLLDCLVEKIAAEVFFIMFLNRVTLMLFHDRVAGVISGIKIEEIEIEDRRWFARDGVLSRQRVPEWAKKAVFFRDRGRCVLCNKDLSNLISLQNEENYDHLIPLAHGGINDVTNLQLLCGDCNRRKSDGEPMTSALYGKWY